MSAAGGDGQVVAAGGQALTTLWPEIAEDPMLLGSDALLSVDGRYRYWLRRSWAPTSMVTWVMLNPSTADATEDDPTIRRCIAFSKAWGFGGMYVVNLFALRSTDPKALLTADDPIGPDNDEAIHLAIAGSAVVMQAWGAFVEHFDGVTEFARRRAVTEAAEAEQVAVWRLGSTKAGHPRHPLYVKGDTRPHVVWAPKNGGWSAPAASSPAPSPETEGGPK